MRKILASLAGALTLASVGVPLETRAAAGAGVVDTSFTTADGARTLQQSIVIDAPVAILWKAFSDTAEFKRWNSPVAAIDFKVGGTLEASYDPKAVLGARDNIKHRIVTYLPERLIVFQNIQAPRALPDGELFQNTVTVIEYQPLAPRGTRVTVSSTGWGTGAGYDRLYRFFQGGNAELLQAMKKAYEAAPAGAGR
ncbi:MAG: SRPBCC domain-containing protein [Caulobacteraceae bacterium]|nr:SRPBCC domain-containing protein [Caulobacteraceae bacterium]